MADIMKVITVVGTRPELIRLSEIIKNLDQNFNHVLVHTNQNFDHELKKVFFDQLNIRYPKYDLKILENSTIKTISKILLKIEEVILKEKPDAFFVLGDTNSALSALVAKKYKIPIFHYEAGNRCCDQRVPEEINRKIVDHISDMNLTYSNYAADNLIREGINKNSIIKVGSPLKEVIMKNYERILSNNIVNRLKLKKNEFFLFSFHREENVDNPIQLKKFVDLINKLSINYKDKIVLSLHPRTRKNLKKNNLNFYKRIIIKRPFGFIEYMNLQTNAKIVFSDSGSLPEEASILDFKAICLRDSFERQETSTVQSSIMSELDFKQIQGIIKILNNSKKYNKLIDDYADENISSKISKIIISHTPIINKNIWKKKS